MYIKIRNDNGFDLCLTCANIESSDCLVCTEGQMYEESEFAREEELMGEDAQELEFA